VNEAVGDLRPARCPISGQPEARLIFCYDAPPKGEIGFRRPEGAKYRREIWQFASSDHYVSRHAMAVLTDYGGDYVDATYGDIKGMTRIFERIIALPPQRSDNAGRAKRVQDFAKAYLPCVARPRLLDVGAGLGVFPHAVKAMGWECVAVDPDARAVEHMNERVGVRAFHGDFATVEIEDRFDILTFNKVLEHVPDPIAMLKHAARFLADGGFVYLELPDGEMAAREGAGREEFFIEHLHIFSFTSIVMLAKAAGFTPLLVERLQEPSTKFTLRAVLAAANPR
jgi:2-polyprenyl-3-methyl-5-hydroxy-6-metoxy-1,4-benzoquinol methylase